MNAKLVKSLAQIIQSLTPEERILLEETVKAEAPQQTLTVGTPQKLPFYYTATPEEWINTLRKWSESHRRDIPLLSDEAVSRRRIYEEN